MTMTSGSIGCSVPDEVDQFVRLRGALHIPAALTQIDIHAAAGATAFGFEVIDDDKELLAVGRLKPLDQRRPIEQRGVGAVLV